MTAKLLRLVKWLWLVLVLGAVARYLWAHWDEVGPQLRTIALLRLGLAVLLLIASKLLLVVLSQRSVALAGYTIPYRRMFTINALSQLAKYLPGGIWHFVGRAGYYHTDGLPLRAVTQAMIVENLWLVFSAFMAGVSGLLLYYAGGWRLAVALAGLVAVWWAVLWLIRLRFSGERNWRGSLSTLGFQALIWGLVGASLWVVLPSLDGWRSGSLAIGAFCISWVIGYVALFAPGGIGVREAAMTALLATALSAQDALLYAAIHRFLWVAAELTLGIVARTPLAAPPPPVRTQPSEMPRP
ncbi:MAG: hypothetical protein ACUVSU_15925 [Aggregatilineaceae bacterium]